MKSQVGSSFTKMCLIKNFPRIEAQKVKNGEFAGCVCAIMILSESEKMSYYDVRNIIGMFRFCTFYVGEAIWNDHIYLSSPTVTFPLG